MGPEDKNNANGKKYSKLTYNEEKVRKQLEVFKQLNDDATPREIQLAEKKLIASDIVTSTHKNILENTYKNKEKTQDYQISLDAINNGMLEKNSPEYAFFSAYNGDDFEEQLHKYQNTYKNCDNYSTFNADIYSRYGALASVTNFDKEMKVLDDYGKEYEKGLFMPKTDKSGMVFDVPDEHLSRRLRNWQEKIDSVEISNENYKDETIMYAVMGDMLQAKNSAKLSKLYDGFGTEAIYNDLTTLEILTFENMFNGDKRGNCQNMRGLVSKSRQNVQKLIDEKDKNGIKQNLINAFDAMYDCVNNGLDYKKPVYNYCMKNMNKLMNSAALNVDLIKLPESQQKQFEFLNKKYDLAKSIQQKEKTLSDSLQKFYVTEGTKREFDPVDNPEIFNNIVDLHVERRIFERMSDEVGNYCAFVIDASSKKTYTENLRNRPLTPTEKLFAEHKEELYDSVRNEILNSKELKNFKEANTFEKKKDFLTKAGNVGLRIVSEPVHSAFSKDFESKVVENRLPDLKEDLKNLSINIERYSDFEPEEKEAHLKRLAEISKQTDKVISLRNGVKDKSDLKSFEPVADDYQKLGEMINDYLLNEGRVNYKDCIKFKNEYRIFALGLSSYSNRAENTVAFEAEFKKTDELYALREKNRNSAFENTVDEFLKNINAVTTESERNESFNDVVEAVTDIKNSMATAKNMKPYDGGFNYGREIDDVKRDYEHCFYAINQAYIRTDNAKLKYIFDNFTNTLNAEADLFANKFESYSKDYSNYFKDKRRESVENLEQVKNQYQDILNELEPISSRVGGNSKEFKKMYSDLNNVVNGEVSAEKMRELSEELLKSTNKYIKEKSIVPSTDKGKKRLEIANKLRAICIKNCDGLKEKMHQDSIRPKLPEYTVNEKADIYEINCYTEIAKGIKAKNNSIVAAKLAELNYINKASLSFDSLDDGKKSELLDTSSVNKAVESQLDDAVLFVKEKGIENLSQQLTSDKNALMQSFGAFVNSKKQLQENKNFDINENKEHKKPENKIEEPSLNH